MHEMRIQMERRITALKMEENVAITKEIFCLFNLVL